MATRKRLSKNFVVEEFDCNDPKGGKENEVPARYHPALIDLCETFLEPMREKFGACDVHSGFRTESWNRINGGASMSYHMYTQRRQREGVAADVSFARGSIKEWRDFAVRLRKNKRGNKGGIGYYPRGGFVHIDTRDYQADWEGP